MRQLLVSAANYCHRSLAYKGNLFGTMFGSKKEETAKFTGEPPRASLTDPPPGYQTPSPDQPYGVGKATASKPTDYYTTHSEPNSLTVVGRQS